jgi:hypothetical protein
MVTKGQQLIAWARRQCELNNYPPLDCHILEVIRNWDGEPHPIEARLTRGEG